MVDHQHMRACVERYVAAFNGGDLEELVDLFAEGATVEDPLGAPVRRGPDAVREFYSGAIASGAKLRLDGPVRTANSTAAFPFSIPSGDDGRRLHIIDVFTFDSHGKVAEMRAIWNVENIE